MSSKIRAKFLDIFGNLKSDAVPRPPRSPNSETCNGQAEPEVEAHNENVAFEESEEIFIDVEDVRKRTKKQKQKKSFFSSKNKEKSGSSKDPDEERNSASSNCHVNIQAADGHVFNLVNCKDVRWGNDFVYYMGPTNVTPEPAKTKDAEERIEKTNHIKLLLEANEKPDHEYLDYISKHLGKNWHSVFRKLGYKQGQIETAEIDNAKFGVSEARYKLLLDWTRNDNDGSLGCLSTVLWKSGERLIVKELAAIYSKHSLN